MNDWIDFKMIKEKVAFDAVLRHYGINLRQVNQFSLRGKCPLPTHSSEKSNGSFGIHLGKNIWSCQSSSCAAGRQGRKGGNIIDFVSVMENCSIRDAALKLKDWFSVSTPAARSGDREEKPETQKPVAETKVEEGREEVINKPLAFRLKDVDPTHPYLKDRGFEIETLKHFEVGFFPGRGLMQGRVVIPIHNEKDDLVAYAGRAIDDTEPKYKFPAGFKKSEVLFNLNNVLVEEPTANYPLPVIVVEGFFDCMKVHQAGFHCVVGLMGCSLSEAQEKLLCQFLPKIILFLDGDPAGREASGTIAARLISKTFVKVVNLPEGIQPDMLSGDEIKNLLS